jgi:hypothetical protein
MSTKPDRPSILSWVQDHQDYVTTIAIRENWPFVEIDLSGLWPEYGVTDHEAIAIITNHLYEICDSGWDWYSKWQVNSSTTIVIGFTFNTDAVAFKLTINDYFLSKSRRHA